MTLDAIQCQVAESRHAFLKALEEHHDEDGQVVVEKFLLEFLSPEQERSQLAREFANETIELIRGFGAEAANMAQSVLIAKLKMETVVNGATLDVLKAAMEKIGTPSASADFAAAAKRAMDKAIEAGVHLDKVQAMAANIVQMRTLALKAFRDENIRLSLADLLKRLRAEADKDAKDKLADEAWAEAKELAEELGGLAIDEAPVLRWRKILEKVGKIVGPKKVDTSPGGTDAMLDLLGQLRKENKALAALDRSYENALRRFDELAV
jgi:hypothetical protein